MLQRIQQLNSVVFWDVTQLKLVKQCRFGTTYQSHLKCQASFGSFGHLVLEERTDR